MSDRPNDSAVPPKWYYWTGIPNMAIDELPAKELALYIHYVRVAGHDGGACWKAARTIAAEVGIHKDTVGTLRDSLERKGWIRVTKRGRDTPLIHIIDRWDENKDRYAPFEDDEEWYDEDE